MKLRIPLAAACVAAALVVAAAPAAPTTPVGDVTVAWSNYPGGVSVAADAADNVYTATWDYNPAGDIYVAKRNPAGALLWEVRHDNTDTTRHEVATWVDTDSAGNVLVSGTIRSGYSNPVDAASLLMKYSPSGQQLWRRVFTSSFDGSSTRRFVMDGQDNAYVLGIGPGPNGFVSNVRQFLPNGDAGWVWYDSSGIGAPLMIKRTIDGQFLVVGRAIYGSINGYAKVSASGQLVWARPGQFSLTAGDAAGDAQGNTYTVDGDYATGQGTVVTKLSPTGAVLWQRTHPMSAYRVEVGPDANPVISGFPSTGTGGAAFAKFDAAGNLLWTNDDDSGVLLHSQMLVDDEGSAYVSGSTLFEMAVRKVGADGSSQWLAYAPSGTSMAMTFGSVGQVYVAGGTTARLDQGPVAPGTADLSLTLADAPDPVRLRRNIVYTATVTNVGDAPAVASSYVMGYPAGTAFVSATTSQGSCTAGPSVTCTLGDLPAGASATVTVTVRARSTGTISAQGTVGTSSTELSLTNNTATTTTLVRR